MTKVHAHTDLWQAARDAADAIVALPPLCDGDAPVELFLRRVEKSGAHGFRMGARGQFHFEEPIHRVVIKEDFYLGTFVVTQEQWAAVWPEIKLLYGQKGPWENPTAASPSHHTTCGLLPVGSVSWYDAMAFCVWLTRHQRVIGGKRPPDGEWRFCRPTESEWEYACRGGPEGLGPDTEYWNGRGEAALREVGWFVGNSGGSTHPVTDSVIPGRVEDHPLGLFGLHGNVWEWCHDKWAGGVYRNCSEGDEDRSAEHRSDMFRALASGGLAALMAPLLPLDHQRVIRGGAWSSTAGRCRSAYRFGSWPDGRNDNLGFRVCLVRGPCRGSTLLGGASERGEA